MSSDKRAFTLAEVLITLAIVGIIAAITIPTIVNKYKTTVASTRLKKFYSMMSQAIQLSEIDNGEITTWTKSEGDIKNEDEEYDYAANSDECYNFFVKYIAPYIKYTDIKKTPEKESPVSEMTVKLTDGSTIETHNGQCFDLTYDINGEKLPNKDAQDKYTFLICPIKQYAINNLGGKHFGAMYHNSHAATNRDMALTLCTQYPRYCGALLQFDNWEFKNDYPYKL